MQHIKKFSIPDIEHLLKEININWDGNMAHTDTIIIEGYNVYPKSMRYKNFFTHGYKCCVCGKEGTYFYLDVDEKQNKNRGHFNLYADDGTLMTKDHIVPKSKGGKNHINNYQTMCCQCNTNKGNIMPKIYDANMIKEKRPSLYYGNNRFLSFDSAVNFAINQIMKINVIKLTDTELSQIRKNAYRRIKAALYEGKNYGKYQWKIEGDVQ